MPDNNLISENIIEIRYKAIPEILDFRGELATAISEYLSLPNWKIDINRVDVTDQEDNVHVFVSFANAGVVMKNVTGEEFIQVANRYLRFLFKRRPYPPKIPISRIGCKARIGFASPLKFDELLERYKSVFTISNEFSQIIDGQLVDVGLPLNYKTTSGNLDLLVGPMKKDQLKGFFRFVKEDDLPEISLYMEFDYWDKPEKEMVPGQFVPILLAYARENWDKAEKIRSLFLAENQK